MPLNTTAVGAAFWNKKTARGSSVHATATRLYSYSTVILQRLPNGHTIGNITRYSQTTSKHQSADEAAGPSDEAAAHQEGEEHQGQLLLQEGPAKVGGSYEEKVGGSYNGPIDEKRGSGVA